MPIKWKWKKKNCSILKIIEFKFGQVPLFSVSFPSIGVSSALLLKWFGFDWVRRWFRSFSFFSLFFFCKLVLRGHSRDHGESIKSGRHQIYSTGSDPFEFAFPFLFPTPFRRPPRLMNSVIDWTFFFCWRHHFSVSSGRCGDVEVMDDSAATPGSPRSISFFFNHFLFVHFF